MLSQIATDLTIALCKKIGDKSFVIYSWDDIFSLLGDEKPEDLQECKNIFEEVRLNSCITLKYKDNEEACFAVTDKAMLITQEFETLAKADEMNAPMVKTDESGNAMIVMPTTKAALESITKKPSKKLTRGLSFGWGMFGGLFGGMIIYGIMKLIEFLL